MTYQPQKTVLTGLALVTATAVTAAAYLSDANTGPAANVPGVRLFVDAAKTTPAPTNHLIWFVADHNRDGVPTAPTPGNILGPDDTLILQDAVKGTLLGEQAGQYQRAGIDVPEADATANIFVYLWNVATNTPVGLAGQTFGLANLGVVPVPDYGSPDWVISTPIHGDQFTVQDVPTTVPEPSILCLLLAGLTTAHAVRRRLSPPARG